jgi:hypothetical protein
VKSGAASARAKKARPEASLEALIHEHAEEALCAAAADIRLTEDLALALLNRRDISRSVIETLSKNAAVMKSRPVIGAIVRHPRTPRHVSLPIARHLYTFELMQIALLPGIAADIKMAAEEVIVSRLETVSAGERLSLAKQSSGRVAAALLLDPEARVVNAALLNPRMTEAFIVRALMRDEAPEHFVEAVCRHPKWSLRADVRSALLRNDKTPLAMVLKFARAMTRPALKDILTHSRLKANVKMYLMKELEERN